MFDLSPIWGTLGQLARPEVFGLMLLGNVIGLVFGVLPGVGGGNAFILFLPLTFGWDPEVAIWFLMGMQGASSFGGSLPAILIKVPGDTVNAVAIFDGYPMTRRGEATRALGIDVMSNILGATIGAIVVIALLPVMRSAVLLFGPPELFWVAIMGLFTIALASGGNFLKGLAGGAVGILFSLIGYSSVIGVQRFTLGRDYLWDGVQLISLFIGLFAIAQVIEFCTAEVPISRLTTGFKGFEGLKRGAIEVLGMPGHLIRSSAIGTLAGIIPGIGATASAFISYAMAIQFSKKKHLFHHGNPEGLVAANASINAKEMGSLIPALGFGIPGSVEGALILAALLFHGLQPGPFLLRDQPGIVWALIVSLWISNVFGTLLGLFWANWLSRLMAIRVVYMAPVILVSSLMGVYLVRNNIWDIFTAIFFGMVGYGLNKAGFPVVTFVIGFLLGQIAEKYFFQATQISLGDPAVFFESGISKSIAAITVLMVLGVIWSGVRSKRAVNAVEVAS